MRKIISKNKKISMIDVAEEAGVSVATVSRVINKIGNVSSDTEKTVWNAIYDLEYKPNILGRNLRLSKTNLILTMVPSISNPFYAEIVEGLEGNAIKQGYNILLCETNSLASREKTLVGLVEQKLADGLVWIDPIIDNNFINNLSKTHPVFVIAQSPLTSINSISIDNYAAMKDVVDYLYKKGKRNIAFFGNDVDHYYNSIRKKAYQDLINKYGISSYKKIFLPGFKKSEIKNAFEKIMLSKNQCDAIISISDVQNIYIIEKSRELNIDIGKDVSVIGFDNLYFNTVTYPTLSSVDQPRYGFGKEAITELINNIENAAKIRGNIILPHTLIERDSTK